MSKVNAALHSPAVSIGSRIRCYQGSLIIVNLKTFVRDVAVKMLFPSDNVIGM